MNYKFNGRLVYNDNAEYEIHSENGQIHNISQIFNKVYDRVNQYIEISIVGSICTIIESKGVLYKAIDGDGLFDWHINGLPMGKRLFNHVDEEVSIVLNADKIGDIVNEETVYSNK